MIPGIFAGGAVDAGGGGATDPHFAKVPLLLHFDGANGSKTFTDSSSYARTSTAYGNAQLTTSSPLVGAASGLFDGSGDYVTYAHNSADDIGTGAFCIEFSVVPSSLSGQKTILAKGPFSIGYFEWQAMLENNNNLHFYWGTRGANQTHLRLFTPSTLSTGVRYDCSIGRDASGNWYGFVDGAACTQYQFSPTSSGVSYGSVTTGTFNNGIGLTTSSSNLWVGSEGGGALFYAGQLDELRFTVGEVRNTSAYTPAFPFPDS